MVMATGLTRVHVILTGTHRLAAADSRTQIAVRLREVPERKLLVHRSSICSGFTAAEAGRLLEGPSAGTCPAANW